MKAKDVVEVNKDVYSRLPEIDQAIIGFSLDTSRKYEVESVVPDNGGEIVYLKELTNIGFNSSWFKVT